MVRFAGERMTYWHRLFACFGAALIIYITATGLGIQLTDLSALVTHAPETDPTMLMLHQHINGPENYSVVSAPDYTAPVIPVGIDEAALLVRTANLGRTAAPGSDLRLVELRNTVGKLAGRVRMGKKDMIFDLGTGERLPDADLPPAPPGQYFVSLRSSIKNFHRFGFLGQWGSMLNGLAGIFLAVMLITGLAQYIKLYRARSRLGKARLFWSAGGVWRSVHRAVALLAFILVGWISVTGFWLSVDNFGSSVVAIFRSGPPPGPQHPGGFAGDWSSPISNAEIPALTTTTLSAFHNAEPGVGIKVLQLRYFAGYAQGVVVAADDNTSQLVYNGHTGARMSMTEPGYPALGFTSGWQVHQTLKQLHRGDYFGITGRWLDTIGALSILYLGVSGVVMYLQMWSRRRRNGKSALVWR